MTCRYVMSLKGLDDFLEAFAQAGQNVDQAVAQALQAGGDEILDEMLSRVPVGKAPHDPHPGNLMRHLVRTPAAISGHFVSVTVGLQDGTDAETAIYGNVQEYGSAHVAAQPYIRPAFDKNRSAVRKAEVAALKAVGVPIG
jgi:HK97 gp10 family phage protein